MRIFLQCTLTGLIFLWPIYFFFNRKISLLTFRFILAILCFIAIFLPILFRFSLDLQRAVLYLNFLGRPSNLEDLKNIQLFNLSEGRNLYVRNGEVNLGVWHLLPDDLSNKNIEMREEDYDQSFEEGYPIMFYLHGNVGSRATAHRLELYRMLTGLGFHVVTFDYRSYGDSTYADPNERDLVDDATKVYLWLIEKTTKSPVFVWGHSLATGLTTHMVANLYKKGKIPKGVILEAPFVHMPSEIEVHPFGTIFRVLPWYDLLFVQPYYTNDEDFNSAKYILEYSSPTLILHAEDDNIIPSRLGQKLYQIGKHNRKGSYGPVSIMITEAKYGYGHKYLCRSPEIISEVEQFYQKFKSKTFS